MKRMRRRGGRLQIGSRPLSREIAMEGRSQETTRGRKPAIRIARWLAVSAALLVAGAAWTEEPKLTELRDPLRDPSHIFQRNVWSWTEMKDRNVAKQNRDYSCGAASLCTIFQYYWGVNIDEQKVLDELDNMLKPQERRDRIKNGLSMADLRRVAVKLGFVSSVANLSIEKLLKSKIPVIVPLRIGEFNHFVVYRGNDGFYAYLADPIRGNVRTPLDEFSKQWQKNVILIVARKGRDLNKDAPLNVKPEEIYLGTLNRVVIQKQVARPFVSYPIFVH
jgi:predicted double-glycine peptidase